MQTSSSACPGPNQHWQMQHMYHRYEQLGMSAFTHSENEAGKASKQGLGVWGFWVWHGRPTTPLRITSSPEPHPRYSPTLAATVRCVRKSFNSRSMYKVVENRLNQQKVQAHTDLPTLQESRSHPQFSMLQSANMCRTGPMQRSCLMQMLGRRLLQYYHH